MKFKNIVVAVFICSFFLACTTMRSQKCPPQTYWDESRKVCVQITPAGPVCPDSSMINVDKAVDLAIACVQADPGKFDKVFATLITIARENPNIDNGEKALKFIKAVAIDAPFVSEKKAKMKWNKFFSPYLFVTLAYEYDIIRNCCGRKTELIKQIDQELANKKVGLLGCMADQAHKNEAIELYQQAEKTACSLKQGLRAACAACCEERSRLTR